MSVEQMKQCILERYDYADKWVRRVNGMSDKQIMAIYFRMLHANELK